MARKRTQDLTKGEITPLLKNMTIPMIWGMFSVISISAADTFFIAQLGTLPLAAISFTFPVVMTLGNLTIGLGTGTTSLLSRVIGTGDDLRTRRIATDSLVLAVLIVSVLSFIGYHTIDPLFTMLGADQYTLPLIREYMEIWYIAMVFLVVPMVGNSIIRSTGDTKTPSRIMMMAALINLILDPILIFGLLGFPELGIKGAAIGTAVSRATTLCASLYILQKKGLLCRHLDLHEILASWKRILHVGLPAASTKVIIPFAGGIIIAILARFGTEAVAAFGVVGRVQSFAMIVFIALSSALNPMIGQNYGAKKMDRVKEILKVSYRFSWFLGISLACVLFAFAEPIVRIFDDNPEVVRIGGIYLRIVPFSYLCTGMLMISSTTFNALGRPLPAVAVSLIRMFGLYVPLAYIGGEIIGARGVFYGAFIGNVTASIIARLWIHRTLKKLL